MTYRQAVELGAHVRNGEKGLPADYTNSITRNEIDTGVDPPRFAKDGVLKGIRDYLLAPFLRDLATRPCAA
jgi:antirestriction protein ArdC